MIQHPLLLTPHKVSVVDGMVGGEVEDPLSFNVGEGIGRGWCFQVLLHFLRLGTDQVGEGCLVDDIPNAQLIGIGGRSEEGALAMIALLCVGVECCLGKWSRVVEVGCVPLCIRDQVSMLVNL